MTGGETTDDADVPNENEVPAEGVKEVEGAGEGFAPNEKVLVDAKAEAEREPKLNPLAGVLGAPKAKLGVVLVGGGGETMKEGAIVFAVAAAGAPPRDADGALGATLLIGG